MVDVRKVLDELKFKLKIKTDSHLAEYLGVTPSALTKWIARDELPSKWQIKIDRIQHGDNGMIIGVNNGNMTINTSSFNHGQEIKEIINLLQYASPQYLNTIKQKLEEFQKMSE